MDTLSGHFAGVIHFFHFFLYTDKCVKGREDIWDFWKVFLLMLGKVSGELCVQLP